MFLSKNSLVYTISVMNCIWLKENESLRKGVQLINRVDMMKFEKFTEHINSNLEKGSNDIFSEEELQKLEKILKLNSKEVDLLVKTNLYLLNRMTKFVFKPSQLKCDLVDYLKADEDKAGALIKCWSSNTKSTVEPTSTDAQSGHGNELSDLSWQLKVELSSDIQKKSKFQKAYLHLQDDSAKNTSLELTHRQLYGMYLKLEAIQMDMDFFI